jgi:hypothetical protein
MNVLFVGGCQHGKIESLDSGKIPMEKTVVPYDPDDRLHLFTGPSAIVNRYEPVNAFTYEKCEYVLRRVRSNDDLYVLRRVRSNDDLLAYVYFASGIKREHLDMYLAEPFISQKLRKIGLGMPKSIRSGGATRIKRFPVSASMVQFLEENGTKAFAVRYGYPRGMTLKNVSGSAEIGFEAYFEHEDFHLVPEGEQIPLDTNYTSPS